VGRDQSRGRKKGLRSTLLKSQGLGLFFNHVKEKRWGEFRSSPVWSVFGHSASMARMEIEEVVRTVNQKTNPAG